TLAHDATGQRSFTAQRQTHAVNVIARLRPDAALGAAKAEVNTLVHNLSLQYPDSNGDYGGAIVQSALKHLAHAYESALRVLFGAVLLLLLLASINIAGLLLPRSQSR